MALNRTLAYSTRDGHKCTLTKLQTFCDQGMINKPSPDSMFLKCEFQILFTQPISVVLDQFEMKKAQYDWSNKI